MKDSYNFLAAGLQSLVSQLAPDQMKEMRRYIEESTIHGAAAVDRHFALEEVLY